ncbi:MAG: hypothetical protein V7749_14265 [Cocleimonas sp.]
MFQVDSQLLSALFDSLNKNNLDFLVLRNYQGLPHSNNAKDVDILIDDKVSPQVINKIIIDICKLQNTKLIWLNELDYLSGFVMAKVMTGGTVAYAKLDFFYGLKWRGIEFADTKEILSNRIEQDNFFIPSPGHEAYIHLINGILYSKTVNSKYLEKIKMGIYDNPLQFHKILTESGLGQFNELLYTLVKSQDDMSLNIGTRTLVKPVRRMLIKGLIRNQVSWELFCKFSKSMKTELFSRLSMGYLLSFSGPDGAGKSSIMDHVIQFFKLTGICKQVTAHHFLPEGIPPLHRLIRFNKKLTKQDYTSPYSEKPVRLLPSMVRFSYYIFAFLLARYKYLLPQFRRNEVVVFDRYYPDLIVDPSRARLSLSKNLIAATFSLIAAKPDVAMILIAKPETLINRKGELTVEKAKQLVQDFSSLGAREGFVLLDNDGTLSQGLSNCFCLIFDKFHAKNIVKLS